MLTQIIIKLNYSSTFEYQNIALMPFQAHRRTHTFFMMVFFICLGITTEVFFTAFTALFTGEPACGKPLWALTGFTYVWMAFIYGLIPLLGILFHHHVAHFPLGRRLMTYVILLYMVEFVSGFLLEIITGSCPWKYTSGLHVMGYIRLDYLPAWTLFVWMVERLYIYVNRNVIQ